ncbi:hypothetical protein AAMO2058_001564300 [Amorphochlora amoebiformis]
MASSQTRLLLRPVLAGFLSLGALGIALSLLEEGNFPPSPPGVAKGANLLELEGYPPYIVIVDAGSTGNRVHVYEVITPTSLQPVAPSSKHKPPLASIPNNSSALFTLLTKIIRAANRRVPIAARSNTPLYIWGTAGVRSLGSESESQLWREISTFFTRFSEFSFRIFRSGELSSLRTISGGEEGYLAYVSMARFLPSSPESKTGRIMVEIGGGSVQIAAPLPCAKGQSIPNPSCIETVSLMGYGAAYFERSLRERAKLREKKKESNSALSVSRGSYEACLFPDNKHTLPFRNSTSYVPAEFKGNTTKRKDRGDFDTCLLAVQAQLELLISQDQIIPNQSPSSHPSTRNIEAPKPLRIDRARALISPIAKTGRDIAQNSHPSANNSQDSAYPSSIIGLSMFYHLVHFLKMVDPSFPFPTTTLSTIKTHARALCRREFSELAGSMGNSDPHTPLDRMPGRCFDSALVVALLGNGLGISDNASVSTTTEFWEGQEVCSSTGKSLSLLLLLLLLFCIIFY